MANSIQSTLVLPTTPKPGADIEAADLSALAALQTLYEQGPPPLVLEPMYRAFETPTDLVRYKLPLPNERADEAVPVDVWIYCLAGAGAQQWSIVGNKGDVDLIGWNGPFQRDLIDADGTAEVEIGPNADYSGDPIFVECIAIFHRRSRTELPEAEFDNGATPVDTAQVDDDKPVSVHRLDDARSLAVETYRRQYRSAMQSSLALPDRTTHIVEIEVPESVSAAAATLHVACYGGDLAEYFGLECVVGTGKVVLSTEAGWHEATISVPTARDGQIRPYRIKVALTLTVDLSVLATALWWEWVGP